MQNLITLPNLDVNHLDELLVDSQGTIRLQSASSLNAIDEVERTVWATKAGVYQFVTTEMIAWLRELIGGRPAIEICAGNGCIGRSLCIPSTDSYVYFRPEIVLHFLLRGITPLFPGKEVLRMSALQAIQYFKPKVVVGAFVPQVPVPAEPYGPLEEGSLGVDEEQIIGQVETYILFGNKKAHKERPIFSLPHDEYHFPWLITRLQEQAANRVWVWNRN